MKVTDCIILAADGLCLDSLSNALREQYSSNTINNIEGQDKADLKRLLSCCYTVLDEVGQEYFPLQKEARVIADTNGQIRFSSFPNRVVEIHSVRKNNRKALFRVFRDRIEVSESGHYTVFYSFVPKKRGSVPLKSQLAQRLSFEGGRVSERLISYGICAEYCVRLGLISEAGLWDRRFKDALHNASISKRERRIPPRRWL